MSYIKKEEAIRLLRGGCVGKYPSTFSAGITASANEISRMPDADVVEVRHGYWIRDAHREEAYCSLCNGITPVDCEKELFYESDFCPSCGAKMDGERRENGT